MVAYCDYIAHLVQLGLRLENDTESLLKGTESTKLDLSEEGYFLSTKKTIPVVDKNGKRYKITIEEE